MDTVILIIRIVLFAVFALAAIGKLLDLKGSAKAAEDFGTPPELAKTFAVLIPFAEIVFAFCLLFVSTSWLGAIGGLILLLSFSGGMIWQMAHGKAPDCHCFGQLHSEPVSIKALVRNIIFALLAVFLMSQGRAGQGPSLTGETSDDMQLVLLITVAVLVAAVLLFLKKVSDNQTEILRRIELLEVLSHEGVPRERNDAGDPHDGLPIGAPFPEFDLKNASGAQASLRTVLSGGRPAVVLFVSPTCEPCKALLPEIERWEAELGDRVNFVFVSSGTTDANAGKFGVFNGDVILQEKRELAELVYARWTPMALFVRADGTIGSRPAAGDNAIRDLIDTLRAGDVKDQALFATGNHNGGPEPRIGSKVPEFSLADMTGKELRSHDFHGKRTLAVFWSPTCPHCTAMMNDLKEWDGARQPSDPELVVFSDGAFDAHSDLGLKSPIILDAGYKTAEQLGMFGTPSAVMVDESGTIVSETAVGASNIWALIGKRK